MNEKKARQYHRAAMALMGRALQLDQEGRKTRAYHVAKRAYVMLEKAVRRIQADEIRPVHIALFKLAANIAGALNDPNRVLELIDEWLSSHASGKATDDLKALARRIMAASLEKAAK